MAKLKPNDGPTEEIPLDLHENLVRQTLRMNPGLAPNMDAKAFIEHETGKFRTLTPEDLEEKSGAEKPAVAVRTMGAFFKQERKKHQKVIANIRRQKDALDKEAATTRRLTTTTLIRFLATNVRSAEDLKEVLSQNATFLQELAVSEKDLIKRTTELMRKLRK